MHFDMGQQVRHRVTGKVGTLRSTKRLDSSGVLTYRVKFDDGSWDCGAQDLVPIYDDPFRLLADPPSPLYPYDGWLRREAYRLLNAYRNDPTAALSNSRVEPQPHQVSVLRRALDKPQARLILADEVGLGKTIEAGLILKELRARRSLTRVLILAPASLNSQWVWELRSKFNEVFVTHDSGYLAHLEQKDPSANPWAQESNVIASFQLARLDGQRERIVSAPWDLVIFDEAHHARRHWDEGEPRATKAYELMEALRDRVGGMLLLTATPMQLHDFELYSLVELVEPGLFHDYADFVSSRSDVRTINELVGWLRLGGGNVNQRGDLIDYFAASKPPHQIRDADLLTLEGRQRVMAWLAGRHRLSQALVRNRKAEVGGFTKRTAHRIPVDPTSAEQKLEADVHLYISRQHQRAIGAGNTSLGLVLVTFRKLLASSTRALATALERRAERLLSPRETGQADLADDEDIADELHEAIVARSSDVAREAKELRELAARARQIEDTKLIELERTLVAHFNDQPSEKVLIFTQFMGTLEMIRARLAPRLSVEVFHGGLDRGEKDRAYLAFKRDAQILVSSEAGGEGRNFQFCHILINYDLPWNPMKIEQRIGRIDRVGQTQNVLIYNFAVRGTLDEQILEVLDSRIQVFTESVGALDQILGDVEKRLKEIFLADAQTARREIARYEVDLQERVKRARHKDTQMRDLVMDARSFRKDDVARLLDQKPLATHDELEAFVRRALARYPLARIDDSAPSIVTIEIPDALRAHLRPEIGALLGHRYRGTFDYHAALQDETLEFFAFGHPVVESLVAAITGDDACPITQLATERPEPEPSLLVDYHFRFSGIQQQEVLFSQIVDVEGVRAPVPVECPDSPSVEATCDPLSPEVIETLELWSEVGAEDELKRQFDGFRQSNGDAFKDEKARLERRYAFEVRHLQGRISKNKELVATWKRSGTPDEKKAIPPRLGLVTADEARIAQVDAERSAELERLEHLRLPAHARRVVSVTRLVPKEPSRT